MKKLSILFLSLFVSSTFASVTPQIESQIKAMLPNTKITEINVAPFSGMYEVLAGDNAFYVNRSEEHTSELQSQR